MCHTDLQKVRHVPHINDAQGAVVMQRVPDIDAHIIRLPPQKRW